jgi:hypothetical protein
MTPGRFHPGKFTAFSVAPVDMMIFPSRTVTDFPLSRTIQTSFRLKIPHTSAFSHTSDIELFRFLQELGADIDAPDPGVVVAGTEKFMDLLEQLPAGLAVFVHKQHPGARMGRFDGGRKACGTRPLLL